MPNPWGAKPPRGDEEYFERMTRAVFTAGLNWRMIEKKWPNFQKAFSGFTLPKVAKFSERDIRALLKDESIVRNEKKIRATIHNAEQVLALAKEFGSFRDYRGSSGKKEDSQEEDLQSRFQHVDRSPP